MRLFAPIPFLLALTCAAPAMATGAADSLITQNDRQRLADYDTVRAAALNEAHGAGAPEAAQTLDQVTLAAPKSWQGMDLTGEWRCRTIKAGGMARLVVYSWFKCRVTDDGSGWMLEKLSGSQRTRGRLFDDGETRLIYLGAFAVNGDPFPAYGSGPDSDQAGYAYRMGDNWWRIEFPSPRYESMLDILELSR